LNRFRKNMMQDYKRKQRINYDLMYDIIGDFQSQQKEYMMRYLEHCKKNPMQINSPPKIPQEKPIAKPIIKQYEKVPQRNSDRERSHDSESHSESDSEKSEYEDQYLDDLSTDSDSSDVSSKKSKPKKKSCAISMHDAKEIQKTLSLSIQSSSSQMNRQLKSLFLQMFNPKNDFKARINPVVDLTYFMKIISNAINMISKTIYAYGNTKINNLSINFNDDIYAPELIVDQLGYRKDALKYLGEVLSSRCKIDYSSEKTIELVNDSFRKWQSSNHYESFRNILQFVLCSIHVLKMSVPVFQKDNNISISRIGINKNTDTYIEKYTTKLSIEHSVFNTLCYTHDYLMFLVLVCLDVEHQSTKSIIMSYISEDDLKKGAETYNYNSFLHILQIENSLDVSLANLLK